MIRHFSLPYIEPPFERILGRMGYNRHKSELPADLEKMIQAELAMSRPLFSLKGNTLDLGIISMNAPEIELENGLKLKSEKLAAVLAPCKKVTLMAATAGVKSETESRFLLDKGEFTRGVILDAIGSETVEAFVEYINTVLAQERGLTGWKPAMRFSPGYGDLPLTVQPVLLELLDGAGLGIRSYPDTHLLDPQKSVTAFIGWYK